MPKKIKQLTFDEVLNRLRSLQFDVREVPGVASQVQVSKYGCAAILSRPQSGSGIALTEKPGVLVGEQIAFLLDRGFQKFFKTSRVELPATADHLKSLHRFSEELHEAAGSDSLYNESLGTVSDEYHYDRVKGRDLPEAQRPTQAWKLPASH
jgi:hypothetical protein